MKRAILLLGMLLAFDVQGQNPLAEHQIKGLKQLYTLALVLQPNMPQEVMTPSELFDMARLRLRHDLPDLKLANKAEETPVWLNLNVLTTNSGASVELSVFRWVMVKGSGEEIFTKVWWDSRSLFGHVSKTSLKEILDTLFTKFAADRLRAQR